MASGGILRAAGGALVRDHGPHFPKVIPEPYYSMYRPFIESWLNASGNLKSSLAFFHFAQFLGRQVGHHRPAFLISQPPALVRLDERLLSRGRVR